MGNFCSRTNHPQAALGALQLVQQPRPQRHLAIQDYQILENDQYLVDVRRLNETPLTTGVRKLIKAIGKIIIILKLRVRHSQIRAWMNVHKALKGTGDQEWASKASLLGQLTTWLHQRGSRQLCQHVKRVAGRLKYKDTGEPALDEQL